MKTIRRDVLLEAVRAGKMISTESYHYDEMEGERRRSDPVPARLTTGDGDFIPGQCNLRESDFRSSSGRAWQNGDGSFTLYVHGNATYDLRLKEGETLNGACRNPRGRLEHNVKMQAFLQSHGIEACAKYFTAGSLKGCWRLYNLATPWTKELADRLNELGFTSGWGEPLNEYSGNGGMFSVTVHGHDEFLK